MRCPACKPSTEASSLADVGFVPPTWEELAHEAVHPPTAEDGDPTRPSGFGSGSSRSGVVFPGDPKEDRWLLLHSKASQRIVSHAWNHKPSKSCSSAVCVSLSLSQLAFAEVAVLSTSLAIRSACAVGNCSLWKTQPHQSTANLVANQCLCPRLGPRRRGPVRTNKAPDCGGRIALPRCAHRHNIGLPFDKERRCSAPNSHSERRTL